MRVNTHCGRAAAGLILLVATGICSPACSGSGTGDRGLETLTIAVKNNPDLELIATDERARILTVRIKSADRVITVSPANLVDGRLQLPATVAAAAPAPPPAPTAPVAPSPEPSATPPSQPGVAVDVRRDDRSASVSTGAGGVRVDAGGRRVQLGPGGVRVDSQGRSATVATGGSGSAAGATRAPSEPAPAQATPPPAVPATTAASPAARTASGRRRLSEPVRCEAQEVIRLDDIVLAAGDEAVHASGACKVVITNSEISGSPYAIRVDGTAQVEIVDSRIEGRRGAIQASGAAGVSGRNTEFVGGVRTTGGARFRDLGGNTMR
jgi:hypothetical protein